MSKHNYIKKDIYVAHQNRCFNCNKDGHMVKDCTKKAVESRLLQPLERDTPESYSGGYGKVSYPFSINQYCRSYKKDSADVYGEYSGYLNQNRAGGYDKTRTLTSEPSEIAPTAETGSGETVAGDAQQRVDDYLMGKQHVSHARLKETVDKNVVAGDAQQRVDDHLMGKQHVSHARLKETVDENVSISRRLSPSASSITCKYYQTNGTCHVDCTLFHPDVNVSEIIVLRGLFTEDHVKAYIYDVNKIRSSSRRQTPTAGLHPDSHTRYATYSVEQNDFIEFMFQVVQELKKFGRIADLRAVSNTAVHHFRNIYVKFSHQLSAERALAFDSTPICNKRVSIKLCSKSSLDQDICPHKEYCLNFVNCNRLHYFQLGAELKKMLNYEHLDSTQRRYRVRVENLSAQVNWKTLKDFMRSAGEVSYTAVYEPCCQGAVVFKLKSGMEKAIKTLNGTCLFGREIKLIKDKSKSLDSSRRQYRILVENLSTQVNWKVLKDLMRKAGEVDFTTIYEPHRAGIVDFKYSHGMDKAVESLNHSYLCGNMINVVRDQTV